MGPQASPPFAAKAAKLAPLKGAAFPSAGSHCTVSARPRRALTPPPAAVTGPQALLGLLGPNPASDDCYTVR